jgi:hypothetical protein
MTVAANTVRIIVALPPAGKSPSKFRRYFLKAIRDAIAHAHLEGRFDAARAEECYRALPLEEPRK